MDHVENIHLASIAQNAGAVKTDYSNNKGEELAKAFLASFKKADQIAKEVHEADKKEKEQDQKQRGRRLSKEDFQGQPDEVEEILDEIDKRLERMLEIAKEYDT
jgi:hypothetical protein